MAIASNIYIHNFLFVSKNKTNTFARILFLDHSRHIETKHENKKKGECSKCGKKFGTKNSANRHENICKLTKSSS